jgi:hypothetical protein
MQINTEKLLLFVMDTLEDQEYKTYRRIQLLKCRESSQLRTFIEQKRKESALKKVAISKLTKEELKALGLLEQ